PTHQELYEVWPSDLASLFRIAGIPRRSPPPFDDGCAGESNAMAGAPPKITSPLRGVTYAIQHGGATTPGHDDERVALTAVTDGLPFRYFVARGPVNGYSRIQDLGKAAATRRLEAGFAIAIVDEALAGDRRAGRSRSGLWFDLAKLDPVQPVLLHGGDPEGG